MGVSAHWSHGAGSAALLRPTGGAGGGACRAGGGAGRRQARELACACAPWRPVRPRSQGAWLGGASAAVASCTALGAQRLGLLHTGPGHLARRRGACAAAAAPAASGQATAVQGSARARTHQAALALLAEQLRGGGGGQAHDGGSGPLPPRGADDALRGSRAPPPGLAGPGEEAGCLRRAPPRGADDALRVPRAPPPGLASPREEAGYRQRAPPRGADDALRGPHVPPPGLAGLGEADEAGYRRRFLYGADGRPVPGGAVVAAGHWDTASAGRRSAILEAAWGQLRSKGFVVLERLLPADRVQELEERFRAERGDFPDDVCFKRMRAARNMSVPPCAAPWNEDWLVRHPLVLALIARYLRNSVDSADEGAAQMRLAQWIASGASLDAFHDGPLSGGRAIMDLTVVVDTPAGAPAQTRHRDTIVPGPCASIGVHIPLTRLQAAPLNGAIGFTAGSHVLDMREGEQKVDLVGAVPQGSVILYDSFLEHHGLENNSDAPRAALFSWYRVPGVYTGHTDENFGELGLRRTMQLRRLVQERLQEAIATARAERPSAEGAAEPHWGFPADAPLVEWGEELVCFRCDRTRSGPGAEAGGRWFCSECWDASRAGGLPAPEPAPHNVAAPVPAPEYPEERLVQLEAQGLNIRPSRGRHKAALLRERGMFLPIDPTSEWLARVSTEPQPEGWRSALKKALGEEPRYDGF